MKLILLLAFSITSAAHATNFSSYLMKATCGELVKVGNGKLLKRLEPNIFLTNPKYVLRAKFVSPVVINETGDKDSKPSEARAYPSNNIAYVGFSISEKFDLNKKVLKLALKTAKKMDQPLYACVGNVNVSPLKYKGNEVSFSLDSVEDALAKMRKVARRHL
jgi:hypothetical protein